MASLSFDKQKNRWRIQFLAPDGSRRSLGYRGSRKAESQAQAFRGRIEELIAAAMTSTALPRDVAAWVARLPEETHNQLAEAGLLERRASLLLGPFLEGWMAERDGEKESTRITWGNAQRNLLDFFGPDKSLREITEADAEAFARWLRKAEHLAESTARKRACITKQIFRSAVKARLIDANPFAELTGAVLANRKRQRFISEADSIRVLEACPDAEIRLLFGLGRWGALRVPSEALGLKWADINWQAGVMHVHATKTEHHAHGGDREVPIFVELRPLLTEAFEQAKEGAVYVIERHRHYPNFGMLLTRLVKQAGLSPWPKIWHNLRATRCTELLREFPEHIVTRWCGHTKGIAEQSYWMTTAEDIARATTCKVGETASGGANVVQQDVANTENGWQEISATHPEAQVFPHFARICDSLQSVKLGDTGLEPVTPTMSR